MAHFGGSHRTTLAEILAAEGATDEVLAAIVRRRMPELRRLAADLEQSDAQAKDEVRPCAAQERTPACSAATTTGSGSPARSSGRRLLVVDDENIVRAVLRRMLVAHGHQVVDVSSPGEALETFLRDPSAFDGVVVDQTMPGMTGIQLAAQLVAIRPGLPILLCSGAAQLQDVHDREFGAVRGVLPKPFTFNEVGEAVRNALREETKPMLDAPGGGQ